MRANLPPRADGQVSLVARRFGLIATAGKLAAGLGILPWPEGPAEALSARTTVWLSRFGTIRPAAFVGKPDPIH
jgi:putative DNA primase/helicase